MPRRRDRFDRPDAHRPRLQGRVQRDARTDAGQLLAQAGDRTRGDRRGRHRRRRVGRGADPGHAVRQYRPPGRAARRLPGQRFGHDDRPPMLVRPDGHRHRRQADHHRQDGCGRRRRPGFDQHGADAGNAHRARSVADRDAQARLHADAPDRRDGRPALRHQPRAAGRICAEEPAAHRRGASRRPVR